MSNSTIQTLSELNSNKMSMHWLNSFTTQHGNFLSKNISQGSVAMCVRSEVWWLFSDNFTIIVLSSPQVRLLKIGTILWNYR